MNVYNFCTPYPFVLIKTVLISVQRIRSIVTVVYIL